MANNIPVEDKQRGKNATKTTGMNLVLLVENGAVSPRGPRGSMQDFAQATRRGTVKELVRDGAGYTT